MKTYHIKYKSKVYIGNTSPEIYYDYLDSILKCYDPSKYDFLTWNLTGRVYRNLYMGSLEEGYFNIESTIIVMNSFIPEPVMYDAFRHLRYLEFTYNIKNINNDGYRLNKLSWFIDRIIENLVVEYETILI